MAAAMSAIDPMMAHTTATGGTTLPVQGAFESRQPLAAEVDTSTTAKLIAATTIATSAITPSTLFERTRCFSLSDRPDLRDRDARAPARAADIPHSGGFGACLPPDAWARVPHTAAVHLRV